MSKKCLTILLMFLLQSCNVTIVYVEKTVYMNDGKALITGSELKDNQASQSADGKLTVPLTP